MGFFRNYLPFREPAATALFDRLTEKTPPKRTAFFPEQKEGKQ